MTKTLVFDLDGTLVDSAPDIAAALNAALAVHGREVPLDQVTRMVGGGVRDLLANACAWSGLELPREETEAALERLKSHYAAEPALRTTVRDWVAEAMIERHRAGARIAVCSNKDEAFIGTLLHDLGLAHWVHGIAGDRPGAKLKPDAEPVLRAIAEAGGKLAGSVMIGDSAPDVAAARAAGIPVILVTGGYGDRDIRSLAADRIAANATELHQAIAALSKLRENDSH